MTNFSDLYQDNRERLEQVRDLIARLEKNPARAPEGSTRYIQRNGYIQYYLRMKLYLDEAVKSCRSSRAPGRLPSGR